VWVSAVPEFARRCVARLTATTRATIRANAVTPIDFAFPFKFIAPPISTARVVSRFGAWHPRLFGYCSRVDVWFEINAHEIETPVIPSQASCGPRSTHSRSIGYNYVAKQKQNLEPLRRFRLRYADNLCISRYLRVHCERTFGPLEPMILESPRIIGGRIGKSESLTILRVSWNNHAVPQCNVNRFPVYLPFPAFGYMELSVVFGVYHRKQIACCSRTHRR
jgi:hypothetical protein